MVKSMVLTSFGDCIGCNGICEAGIFVCKGIALGEGTRKVGVGF